MGYTHGRMWDEQMIEDEIWKVVNTLGINHFPTHSEMESLLGGKALACKVSKYRGSVYWANRLNLPIKESETAFGNRFELKAMNDILINTGLDSVPTTSRHPYDLLVDRSVKIDVKVAKESKNGNGVKFYRFNIEKEKPTCDIFILYCVDNDETYKKY